MKKILHSKYNFAITLEENQINEIVIENPAVLVELIEELSRQEDGKEGKFVLSEEGKILSIEKNMVFVKEPFSIDVNHRKMLTKLYTELEHENDMLALERTDFYRSYVRYMEAICEKCDLALQYDIEPECQEVFKFAKIKIDVQAETFLEQIVEFIKATVELLHQRIFIFLNLKLFLTSEELEGLYRECFCRKVHLILIEAVFHERLMQEQVCIIDKDKCIIYL